MYPVTTVEEAREAVQDYVRMKPEFIKIWVDNRDGRVKTLTPPLYRAIIEEAHKHNVPVGVHNVTLANAKELMRAGVEGWLHVPVRQGEAADDELIAIVKERIARNDRPLMWMTPGLQTAWMNTQGQRPAWLDDPLLRESYSPQHIREYWGRSADEDDAGGHRARPQKSRVGWQQCDEAQSGGHADRHGDRHRAEPFFYWLFQPHGFGKLCCDRHDAGRGDCRGDARFGGNREGEFRDDGAWQERRFHRPRRQSYREHCQHAADHQGLPTGTGSPPRRDDGEVADAIPHRIDAIDHIGTQTCSAE